MPTRISTPFAVNGDKTAIPQTDPSGFVSFEAGYPVDYSREIGPDAAAKPIERTKQNWLWNLITAELKEWQDQGYPIWYSSGDKPGGYPINAQVRYNNQIYRSLADSNTHIPGANPLAWELQRTQAEQKADIPSPEMGSMGVVDFNNLPTGSYNFISDTTVSQCPNSPPGAVSGHLVIYSWASRFTTQTYLDYKGKFWVRAYYQGTGLTPWYRMNIYSDVDSRGYYNTSSGILGPNFDSYRLNGFWFLGQGATQAPTSTQAHHLIVVGFSNDIVLQQAFGQVDGRMYSRVIPSSGAPWTAWTEMLNRSDIPMVEKGSITSGIDFNAVEQGSMELSPAAGAASTNQPVSDGGWLESKWANTGDVNGDRFQRFTAYSGSQYNRAFHAGAWSVWRSSLLTPGELVETFSSSHPSGCFLCNGQQASRTTFAALFAAIGTTYGAGDGSTTFNVPNFIPGTGTVSGYIVDLGTTTPGAVINHNHQLIDNGHPHGVYDPGHTHVLADPGHAHAYRGHIAQQWFEYNSGGGAPGVGVPLVAGSNTDAAPSNVSLANSATGISLANAVTGVSVGATGGTYNLPAGTFSRMYIAY